MVRPVDEAEHPVEDAKLNAEATSLVPRERPPQQTAEASHIVLVIMTEENMVPPESLSKGPKKPCHSALTRLVKELGQVTDPDLKGSCKARRTALKAVLACLQSPNSTAEERQQILVNSLAAQVTEVWRLEQMVISLQLRCDTSSRLRETAERELARVNSISSKLQELCRSLQSHNGVLKEQLERKDCLERAQTEQAEDLQKAVLTITARLDDEKSRVADFQSMAEETARLKEQLQIMQRQADIQQELLERRDQHAQAVQNLLAKQEEGEVARQQRAAAAMADLQKQNELLQQQTARQEALLDQQQGQFAECHTAIQQATDSFATYQQSLAAKQEEVDKLSAEVKQHKKLHKLLREECGVNVLDMDSVRKTKAQKAALESLCRKLQEDNKRLAAQAPADLADGSDQAPGEEGSGSEVLHVDVAPELGIRPCKQLDVDADKLPAAVD